MTYIDLTNHPNLAKTFNASKFILKITGFAVFSAILIIGSLVGINLLITLIIAPIFIIILIVFKIRENYFYYQYRKSISPSSSPNSTTATPIIQQTLHCKKVASSKYFGKTIQVFGLFVLASIPMIGPVLILALGLILRKR